jgi:hypothetical protein
MVISAFDGGLTTRNAPLFSATIGIDRFHRANKYLIGVPQQHINELEAGSFEQAHPAHDRHAVSNATGIARAQERCMVIAKKPVGSRPERLPILARVAGRLLSLPLFDTCRERCLRRGGLCEQEYPAATQRPMSVLD